MKKSLFLLIFFYISFSYIYSVEIAIDFRGATYDEITNVVEMIYSSGRKIYFCIVDDPFRKLESQTSLYDFTLMNGENFSNTIYFLSEKKIDTYLYLSLFVQPRYFSRKLWNIEDFTFDSINTNSKYVLDIDEEKTRSKLKSYFSIMKSISKKWCLDLSELPENEEKKILDFCQKEFKDSIFHTSKKYETFKITTLHSKNYWELRKKAFLYPIANLENLTNYVQCYDINLIESKENSINNIATIVFLLLNKEKVLISYKLITKFFIDLLSFLNESDLKVVSLNRERLIFSNKEKILIINLGTCYEAIEIDFLKTSENFFTFSKTGGGWIEIQKGETKIFLFPGSISCYYLNKK